MGVVVADEGEDLGLRPAPLVKPPRRGTLAVRRLNQFSI
jgi:hypothetical protein